MKQAYVCTVSLLLDVCDDSEGADAVSAILSEQMQRYISHSALLDWAYIKHLAPVEIEDDYEPDYSTIPDHPSV